jgi:SAM-dependent methyltransferase
MAELPVTFLDRLRALEGSYLRESDPVRQSGFGGGHERWRTERELVLDAVPADGDFLDIGCANGYLLECLVKWGQARHIRLTPYGVDFGVTLITLAKKRLPQYASHFWVANAWEGTPPRTFHYVYSVYDCVPEELLPEYIRRLLTRYVETGGTLIMGAYGSCSKQEAARDIATDIAAAGFRVAGSSSRGALPVSRVAWIRAEQRHGADAPERAAHA